MREGFGEFWKGYLLGLAFTASTAEGDPLFNNPGGDIADVVDLEELEESLDSLDRAELFADCVSFFSRAHFYLDGEFERAGSDFHLTRNGHGAGFWDGDWPTHGELLSKRSKCYGSAELELSNGQYYILR